MTRAEQVRAAGEQAARLEAEELTLPSGAKILARRPDLVQLAAWGRLPLGLVSVLQEGGTAGASGEDVVALIRNLRELLVYCWVEPRITENPREGEEEIHPRHISQEDCLYTLRWAVRHEEARKLEPFRGERRDASGGDDGVAVPAAAERSDGDRG